MANFDNVKKIPPVRCRILFILLCLPFVPLFAQTPLRTFEATAGAGFAYSADTASDYYYNYEALRELAREHLLEVHDVKLQFAVRIMISVFRDEDGKPYVSIGFRDTKVSGHTSYRGFDLSPFLVPASCKVELTHADKTDPTLSRTYSMVSNFAPGTAPGNINVPISPFDPAKDTLTAEISEPMFGSLELDRLRDRINFINDYYASASLLETILAKGNALRTDSLPLMPFVLADIMEISRVTDLVTGRAFDSTLLDGAPDPRGLRSKRQEARRLSKTLVYNFLDQLDKASVIIPAAGIDSMSNYFVDGMIRYIRLSSLMSEFSGNIYSDYPDQYFSFTAFPDEPATVLLMLQKIWSGADTDTLLSFVSFKIYDAYKLRGMQLIAQNKYAEAFSLIRNARLFRQRNPWLKGANGTEELLAEAAKGVYSSYLGIAATSISYEKFGMAEVYMNKALDYRRNNETWFSTDTLYGSVFMKLFRMRLEHCDRLVGEGAYSEAIDCYHNFVSRFEPELVAMVSPWIKAKTDTAWRLLFGRQEQMVYYYMKEDQYDSLFLVFENLATTFGYLGNDTSEFRRYHEIRAEVLPVKYEVFSGKAHRALEARNYRDAWTYCLVADSVAIELGILHDSAFCALQRDVFRYHQAEEISYRTGYIWSDQFDSAWIYIVRVKETIESYGLSDDPVLSAAVSAYELKILRKQCMNRIEEAEILVMRASMNAEKGRYVPAFGQFRRAGEIADGSPACNLRFPPVGDSLAKYRAPAEYQSQLDSLQHKYIVGNYKEALLLLADLKRFYGEKELARFGLDSLSMNIFVSEKDNPALTTAAIEMMIANQRPDEALGFLSLLKRQGQDPESTASIQETIGAMLAERDRGSGKVTDCGQALKAYTGGDKWYRVLEKSYCNAF